MVIACEKDNNTTSSYKEVTVNMGANSASDVYYSLANGTINTVNRSDWDIAFSIPTQSATAWINEGAGVEFFCVGDTTAWESIDENTITNLQSRDNDNSGWTIGAFNRNLNSQNPFNFGWGHYDIADHVVYGDSIYVIKLSNGIFKKFFYRKRIGGTSTHLLSWANLDGSDPVNTSVDASSYLGTRNFIQYSIVNQEIVESEPLKGDWDLLFTRYIAQIPAGPGMILNYPVMGILTNSGVEVAKVTGKPAANARETDIANGYSGNADAIGYNWKVSDPVTHEISIADSTSYFIQSVDSVKYQIYFTGYGGNTAGTINFKVKKVE